MKKTLSLKVRKSVLLFGVHYTVPHRDKTGVAEKLKQNWLQPDKRSAEELASLLIAEYESQYPEAMRYLEEGLEDSLQFYFFPEIDKHRISSTQGLERKPIWEIR